MHEVDEGIVEIYKGGWGRLEIYAIVKGMCYECENTDGPVILMESDQGAVCAVCKSCIQKVFAMVEGSDSKTSPKTWPWISVKDRLPKPNTDLLALEVGCWYEAFYSKDGCWYQQCCRELVELEHVTHWTYVTLPEVSND